MFYVNTSTNGVQCIVWATAMAWEYFHFTSYKSKQGINKKWNRFSLSGHNLSASDLKLNSICAKEMKIIIKYDWPLSVELMTICRLFLFLSILFSSIVIARTIRFKAQGHRRVGWRHFRPFSEMVYCTQHFLHAIIKAHAHTYCAYILGK